MEAWTGSLSALSSPDKGEECSLFLLKTFETWGREVNGTFPVGPQKRNGLVRVGHQTGHYVHWGRIAELNGQMEIRLMSVSYCPLSAVSHKCPISLTDRWVVLQLPWIIVIKPVQYYLRQSDGACGTAEYHHGYQGSWITVSLLITKCNILLPKPEKHVHGKDLLCS